MARSGRPPRPPAADPNSAADPPEVIMARAVADAQEQHRRLVAQAAVVIAEHKRIDAAITRVQTGRDRALDAARAALEEAHRWAAEDPGAAARHRSRASAAALQVATADRRLQDLRAAATDSAAASDQARAAVARNSAVLDSVLHERQRLLSMIEHTRLQEQIVRATRSLGRAANGGT